MRDTVTPGPDLSGPGVLFWSFKTGKIKIANRV